MRHRLTVRGLFGYVGIEPTFDPGRSALNLHDFVVVMERVRDAALRTPASEGWALAVHGIEEATTWAITVGQRGSNVTLAAVHERARASARQYARLRIRQRDDGADLDAVLRDAFAVGGSR